MRNFPFTSSFAKNSFTLIGGTFLAQLLPLLLSPVISRLYSPENMALWGLYMSIVPILLSISTGSYELSIMLPKKDEEAINLFSLSILLAIGSFLLFIMVALFFNNALAELLNNPFIAEWIVFIPISVLVLAISNSLMAWYNRKGNFKILAINKINKNWSITSVQLLLHYIPRQASGLISGQIFGEIISAFLFAIYFFKHQFFKFLKEHISLAKMKSLAFDYKKFPLYTMPTACLDNISSQILTIVIAIWFTNGLTGSYYLAVRLLSAPMALVGSSVSQTFFQKFTEIINMGLDNPKKFIYKIWMGLFFIAIIPLTIIFFWGEPLFVFVFGSAWENAGRMASVMSPMILLSFISSPTSVGFIVLRKQSFNLIFGIVVFLFRPLSFYLGYMWGDFFLGLKILVAFEVCNTLAYNLLMLRCIDWRLKE